MGELELELHVPAEMGAAAVPGGLCFTCWTNPDTHQG